jgi:hypothetical protein
MNKNILSILVLNKTITFGGIKPLNGALNTFGHNANLLAAKNKKIEAHLVPIRQKNSRLWHNLAAIKPNRNLTSRDVYYHADQIPSIELDVISG